MRLVSDVRLVNIFRDKKDYPTCGNPSLVDIEQMVEFLDRNFPGVPRRVAKRDAGDSAKRVAKRPDCVSILRAEFPGGIGDTSRYSFLMVGATLRMVSIAMIFPTMRPARDQVTLCLPPFSPFDWKHACRATHDLGR